MLEKCVLKSYLILLLTDKIHTFSYFLMKIPTFLGGLSLHLDSPTYGWVYGFVGWLIDVPFF